VKRDSSCDSFSDSLFHIHIAEQEAEVAECVAMYGKRPVDLLFDTCDIDARWTLVHATHADAAERSRIVASGACVAVCPLTEAYLGDGLFAATDYVAAGGAISIGSDSNVRIDAIEELRWLEYGQRLRDRRRARLATDAGIGAPLWAAAARGGAQATGFECGAIATGKYADFVVLDEAAPPFAELEPERWLDAWLVGGSRSDIAAVYVGGVAR
jgi:formimidoylglutamate deiminase